jgi:hypothetical protein
MSRRIIVLLVVLAVVVLAAAAAGYLAWSASSRAKDVKRFKARTSSDWTELAAQAEEVTASLLRVTSGAEMADVASKVSKMRYKVARVVSSSETKKPPSGYREFGDKQSKTLASLDRYLATLGDIASTQDPSKLSAERGTLEDRARSAQDDVNEMMTEAKWLRAAIPGDFYQAGGILTGAFEKVDPQLEAQRQQVYDTAKAFLEADIFHQDFDTIWSLFDNRLHTGFDYYKITKEKLAEGWQRQWGEHRPVNFYISRSQIDFPSPGNATVKAIGYVEHEAPKVAEIRLVNEGGTWKFDSYPFVGFE